jgi:hypothetical protein
MAISVEVDVSVWWVVVGAVGATPTESIVDGVDLEA